MLFRSVPLKLKDVFGGLELETCTDTTGSVVDCLMNVIYTYSFANVGTNVMNITTAEVTRNKMTTSVLGSVPMTSLSPGQSTAVNMTESIDFCVEGTYVTTLFAEAQPPSGSLCSDTDEYVFQVGVSCRVDVEVACVSMNGVACSDIETPSGSCTDLDDLTVLTFTYAGGTCDASINGQGGASTCEDFNGGPAGGDVRLVCADGVATLFDQVVSVGSAVTVNGANGGKLPETMICSIASPTGTSLQTVTINTSGTVPLKLKDVFGGLELETCTDTTGSVVDCLMNVIYTYSFANVGTNVMNITTAEVTRNNVTTSVLGSVPMTSLSPGQSTAVNMTEVIDFCVEGTYVTTLFAEAMPPNNLFCSDVDTYEFSVIPPTPMPTPTPTPTPSTLAPTPTTLTPTMTTEATPVPTPTSLAPTPTTSVPSLPPPPPTPVPTPSTLAPTPTTSVPSLPPPPPTPAPTPATLAPTPTTSVPSLPPPPPTPAPTPATLYLSIYLSIYLSLFVSLLLSLSLTALLILSFSLSIFLSVFLSGPVSFSITYIFRNFFILILTLTFGLTIWRQMALSLQQVSTYLTTLIT